MKRFLLALAVALLVTFFGLSSTHAQTPASTSLPTDLSHLLIALRYEAATLESNSATRVNFESFTSSRKLTPGTIRYSDDVVFGELGILRLRHVHVGALPSASKRNQSESRMPEMGTSGCATRKCRCVQWEIDPPR